MSEAGEIMDGYVPEGYTAERAVRESRLIDLVNQVRELADTELPGAYSSDAILQTAAALWCCEQGMTQARVAGRLLEELTELLMASVPNRKPADPRHTLGSGVVVSGVPYRVDEEDIKR